MEAATLMLLGLMAAPTDDKQAHYYAGAAVAQVAQENGLSAWESCGLTLAAAAAKEAWDANGHGVVDGFDGLATVAGCQLTYRF